MTFTPLTKEDIGVATWNAEKAVLINHVRSAVEGLREELRKRPPLPADVNWEAGHRKAQQRALYLLDKWFPVFSQSLSEDAKINDSCSQQATSAPSSEAKSSVSHHVSMGAATESVANSEGRQQSMATCCRQQSEGSSPSPSSSLSHSFGTATGDGQRNNSPAATVSVALCSSVWEDDDMLVNCELPRGHEGEHRVNGDLGFHWKNDSEQTSTFNDEELMQSIKSHYEMHLTKLIGWLVKNHKDVAIEYQDSLSQPSVMASPSESKEYVQHGVPAGELSKVIEERTNSATSKEIRCAKCTTAGSNPAIDVKHAARKGCTCIAAIYPKQKCICKHGSGAITKKFVEENKLCKCECHKKEGEEK